jgi:hypothetical protein
MRLLVWAKILRWPLRPVGLLLYHYVCLLYLGPLCRCVADSIRGYFDRELAIWWCGRVSLLITQVKLQRAWSALGWVTATRYKWWQRSDSGVWWRPVWGGALGLCGHVGTRIHPITDVVSSGDDGGFRHERRMPLLSRCQTSRGNSHQALGRSFPEKGKVWRTV